MEHSRALIILGDLELMKLTVAGSTDSACRHLLLPTCADVPKRKAGFSKALIIPLRESLHRQHLTKIRPSFHVPQYAFKGLCYRV